MNRVEVEHYLALDGYWSASSAISACRMNLTPLVTLELVALHSEVTAMLVASAAAAADMTWYFDSYRWSLVSVQFQFHWDAGKLVVEHFQSCCRRMMPHRTLFLASFDVEGAEVVETAEIVACLGCSAVHCCIDSHFGLDLVPARWNIAPAHRHWNIDSHFDSAQALGSEH